MHSSRATVGVQAEAGRERRRLGVVARQMLPQEGFHSPAGAAWPGNASVSTNAEPIRPMRRNFW